MKEKISRLPILISIAVTAVVVGGIVYGWQKLDVQIAELVFYQKIFSMKDQITELQEENTSLRDQMLQKPQGYDLLNDHCGSGVCLFEERGYTGLPVGVATIEGYYTERTMESWDEEEICRSLTITNGTPELIDTLSQMVDDGLTYNTKDEFGRLVMNIDFDPVSTEQYLKIKGSSEQYPIELIVLVPFARNDSDREVSECESSVQILGIKEGPRG
ncbi:MAG: hypothetical protein KAS07_02955 [Candidatus Pacebacteria bacterium]|nr:hypothetical protein [Candidatus Paceibacterota bacterium]